MIMHPENRLFTLTGQTLFHEFVYFTVITISTVGYGDIYPITKAGRIITMISSMFGIAIVALPAGIITAGYMDALNDEKDDLDIKGDE